MSSRGEITFQVRYCECDPMGVAHHSHYPVWFEMGRTELLRESGISYRDLEASGVLIAVVQLEMRLRKPARYDDLLRLETTLTKAGHVKLEHDYRLFRDSECIATASTVLASLDRAGRPQPLPDHVRGE